MGIGLMNQVDAVTNLKGNAKHALSNLARWADDGTCLVWHKQETQAESVGCSVETIRTATKRLEKLNHLSRLCTTAKVTLYLLHPGDSLADRPMLDWSAYQEHLRKSHFSKSDWPRIAGWLAHLGVLSEDQASNVFTIYHKIKPRKRANRGRPPFEETQIIWAIAMKNLGLDPKTTPTEPLTVGAEYKGNESENIPEAKDVNGVPANESDQGSRRQAESRQSERPATGSIIEQMKGSMTAAQLEEARAQVRHILDGHRRADRYTMVADQPDTIDAPE